MKDSKGNTICVVAGGDYGTCILDTVEILDTSRIDEGWSWGKLLFLTKFQKNFQTFISIVLNLFKKHLGPTLPFKLYGSPMVTSPSGKGVVIVGGYNASTMKYSKALLELKSTFKILLLVI